MTYDISKELQEIAEKKDAFNFDLSSYKIATLQELESYKNIGKTENLANIAINTILLIDGNQSLEIIGNYVKALPIKNKNTELADLEKIISNIQYTLKNNIFTKANVKAILRATSSLIELENKNFRRELATQIQARLAEKE